MGAAGWLFNPLVFLAKQGFEKRVAGHRPSKLEESTGCDASAEGYYSGHRSWTVSTNHLYLLLVLLVAAERFVELAISRRHEKALIARGGREAGAEHFPLMAVFHTLFLIACPLEVFLLDRPFVPALGLPMLALLVGAMALRYWAIATLGEHWTARVIVVPQAPPVTGGPYRFARHPNYLAVVVEMFAMPLVHTAWVTAIVASLGNAAILRLRIRAEEEALAAAGSYRSAFAGRPRFLPGLGGRG